MICCSKGDDNATVATIPIAPTNLDYTISVMNTSTNPYTKAKINLTWTDNSNNEKHFVIERKKEGFPNWVDLREYTSNSYKSVEIVTYSYSNGHEYYALDQYRVCATNVDGGQSTYSNVITVEEITYPNGPCNRCE